MAISRVTSQDASATSTTSSVTATYPATPTQNDLLIAFVTGNVNNTAFSMSGWTSAVEQGVPGSTVRVGIFYKVAGAGESTSVTASQTSASVMSLIVCEYQGAVTSLPLDVVASAADAGSTVTSQSTGTTATTAQAAELAVAAIGLLGVPGGTFAWTNSFANIAQTATRLGSAERIVSSIGTYETTASWPTARRAAAAIATFKAASVGLPDRNVPRGVLRGAERMAS